MNSEMSGIHVTLYRALLKNMGVEFATHSWFAAACRRRAALLRFIGMHLFSLV